MENALISDSSNCGAPGTYRNPREAKRGRPRDRVVTGHAPDKVGVNTGPDERALIWLAWDNYGGKLGKYAAAYNKMIDDITRMAGRRIQAAFGGPQKTSWKIALPWKPFATT